MNIGVLGCDRRFFDDKRCNFLNELNLCLEIFTITRFVMMDIKLNRTDSSMDKDRPNPLENSFVNTHQDPLHQESGLLVQVDL